MFNGYYHNIIFCHDCWCGRGGGRQRQRADATTPTPDDRRRTPVVSKTVQQYTRVPNTNTKYEYCVCVSNTKNPHIITSVMRTSTARASNFDNATDSRGNEGTRPLVWLAALLPNTVF